MYKKINISNFRGIENLEIDDLKTINLLLGKNNCGKTSILEAIYLITGISIPSLSMNINNFRNLIHSEIDDFRFIYRNLDFDNIININTVDIKNNIRELIITPDFFDKKKNIIQSDDEKIKSNNLSIDTLTETKKVNGLKYQFKINNEKYESKIKLEYTNNILNPINFQQTIPKEYKEDIIGNYLLPNLSNINLDKIIEKIFINKDEDKIISALKVIDQDITNIKLGTNGMIYIDLLGINKLLPINIMGDGIRKILTLLAYIIHSKDRIILIDEIENGLHYSSIKILWEALIKAALENNVQLFITSHNFEILKYLNLVLKDREESIKNEIRSYTIIKEKDFIKSYCYNYESFNHAISQGIEIR